MKYSLYALLLIITSPLLAFQSPEDRAERIRDCKMFREVLLGLEKSYAQNLRDIENYQFQRQLLYPERSILGAIVLFPIDMQMRLNHSLYEKLISDYYSQDNNIKREFQNAQRAREIAHFREKLKEDYCTSVEEHQE